MAEGLVREFVYAVDDVEDWEIDEDWVPLEDVLFDMAMDELELPKGDEDPPWYGDVKRARDNYIVTLRREDYAGRE